MSEKLATTKIDTPVGKTALDVLRERGQGLPSECGGQGTCGLCRVRVLQGTFNPPTAIERNLLPAADRHDGFRLACRLMGKGKVQIAPLKAAPRQLALAQCRQKKKPSLYGIAIDLGTTTLRLALLDVVTHERLGAVQCPNPQAAFGADVMARLAYAMRGAPQRLELARVVRDQMFEQIVALANQHNVNTSNITRVCVVANTAMTHLVYNEPVESLALLPYRSALERLGCLTHPTRDWGWRLAFLAGVIAAPLLWLAFTGGPPAVSIEAGLPVLLVAGFLVGLGTVTGNGCTSGHGVCGLARFSRRSVVATGTFMGTAILTVILVRLAGGL